MRLALLFAFTLTSLASLSAQVVISEIHYDNASDDVNEAIELTGPAGTDLTGYKVVLYNGSNGTAYNTKDGSEFTPSTLTDQLSGFGSAVFTYPPNGIQNGSPDGVALIDPDGNVLQFLSYEGSFTASGGPADGVVSTDIGVRETSSTPIGASLSDSGEGFIVSNPASFGTPDPNLVQVLPVTLTSLTAVPTAKSVMVKWSTATESANAFFAVERSATGNNFSTIGRVEGNGTTNQSVDYVFEDDAPLNGTSYYRLRQVDFSGATTLSHFVSAAYQGAGLSVYPNPVGSRLFLSGNTAGTATVVDLTGRTLRATVLTGNGIDVSDLKAGTYLLQLTTEAGTETLRFVRK